LADRMRVTAIDLIRTPAAKLTTGKSIKIEQS